MRRHATARSSKSAKGRVALRSKKARAPLPPQHSKQTLAEFLRGCGGTVRHRVVFLEALTHVSEHHPTHCGPLREAFFQLSWRGPPEVPDQILHSHAQELLERVVENQPLPAATQAEVLVCLCQGSLRAPLDHDALALCEQLFLRIFGKGRLQGLSRLMPEEEWPYRARELFASLLHRARDDSRNLTPKRQHNKAEANPDTAESTP